MRGIALEKEELSHVFRSLNRKNRCKTMNVGPGLQSSCVGKMLMHIRAAAESPCVFLNENAQISRHEMHFSVSQASDPPIDHNAGSARDGTINEEGAQRLGGLDADRREKQSCDIWRTEIPNSLDNGFPNFRCGKPLRGEAGRVHNRAAYRPCSP